MTNKIKIILAGAWLHPMYEEASCYALQNLGAEVIPYNWGHLYKRPPEKQMWRYFEPS